MYNLKYLKDNLPNLYIKYRPNLQIPKDATCGLEVEFVEGVYRDIFNAIKERENLRYRWQIYQDSSVHEINREDTTKNKGGEVISPIITSEIHIWNDLREICNIIKNTGGTIDERAASHIHIGTQTFKNNDVMNNFLLIWSAFEDIINKFLSGEYINPKENNKLAIDCRNEFKEAEFDIEKLRNLRERNLINIPPKVYDVSLFYFESYNFARYNTVEFRKIRGTLEEEVWQNNVNFILHLINYAERISKNELSYIKKTYIDTEEYQTDYVKPNKAIFLSEAIYDNDIDKLYFLKQYFKDFDFNKKQNAKIKLIKRQQI